MVINKRNKHLSTALGRVIPCLLLLLVSTGPLQAQSVDLAELETLLAAEKYSIVLEKSLNLLNTKAEMLTPIEAGALNYFTGTAYKKNGNEEMAVTYLMKLEQEFPASQYLKQSLLELADLHKDDYFKKESFLEKVFDKFPKTPEAITAGKELSKGYLTLKNYKKALPLLEKLVNMWKVAEDHPILYLYLALAYAGNNDYIEAIDYLRMAEKRIPDTINRDPEYIFHAGKICHNNQNFDKAIKYLSRLFNTYPRDKNIDEASIILANAYERKDNHFMSSIYLIKAVEKDPPNRQKKYGLLLNLGRMLAQLDQSELDKIRKNDPLYANPKKILNTVKKNSPVFNHRRTATILLSSEFKKSKDFEQVIDNYYRFLKEKRDPLVEKLFKDNLNLYIAELERNKDYDKVFRFWVIIKKKKSLLSETNLLKLGQILRDVGLYLNAEEVYVHLRRYTMFRNSWPTVWRQLARLYFATKRYDDYPGIRDRIKDLKEPETDEFLYYGLVISKEKDKKEFGEQVKAVEPAERITGDYHFKVQEIKAGSLEESPKTFDNALELYDKLLDYPKINETQQFEILLKIADLHFKKEEYATALDFYNRAETLKDNNEWILFRKHSIFLKTGSPRDAKETLDKLKKVNPNSYWIQQAEKNVR